jgi:hypothetical protein
VGVLDVFFGHNYVKVMGWDNVCLCFFVIKCVKCFNRFSYYLRKYVGFIMVEGGLRWGGR